MTRPTMHRHTTLQALERRVAHLESMVANAGIRPQTIEQCVKRYLQSVSSATPEAVARYAEHDLGLTFKPTSISAVMCKMVRMGLIQKARCPVRGYHWYRIKQEVARGPRKSS